MTGVQTISAGSSHSLFLKTDGSVRACGQNSYGRLGDGTTTNRLTPVQVMTDVQGISAGWDHSLFLKTNGNVWACGNNEYGQLGDDTTTSRYIPLQVLIGVQAISAGSSHSLFLKTDAGVRGCGYNAQGQLGQPIAQQRTPVPTYFGVNLPVVAIGTPSRIADSSATLDGTVDSQLSATTYQFEYGTTTAYGQVTPIAITGSGSGPVPVSADLTGLTPNTLYHYRLKANNGSGTTYSEVSTFTTLSPPDIALEAPAGSPRVSGLGSLDFDPTEIGQSRDISVTVKNEGGALLSGLSVSISTPGPEGSALSSVGSLPSSLGAGASATFILRFTPESTGMKSATLTISSNDPDENPFTVMLAGTGSASSGGDAWLQAQFGTDANNPAISGWNADPDNDGVSNLLERAFNLNPLAAGNALLTPGSGTSGLPFISTTEGPDGPLVSIQYLRLKASTNPGLAYIPQFSTSLDDNAWSAAGGTETVESIDASWERVTVTDTLPSSPSARFGRVKVTTGE